MQRRNFIGNLARGAGSLIVLPTIITACEKDPIGDNGDLLEIDLTDSLNSALLSPGGYIVRNEVIIINTGGSYTALSSVCTHQGCQVTYNATDDTLPCPCHGSIFSTSGSVLNGPADEPLATYPVTRDGDILEIDMG